MRYVQIAVAACLCPAVIAGCGKPEAPEASAVVLARVGNREIVAEDLQAEARRRIDARLPVPEKEALLREMARFAALVERAHDAGVADTAQTQREIGNMLIGKLKEKKLAPRLSAIEIGDDEVRAEYEKRIDQYTRPAQIRLAALFLNAGKVVSAEKRQELIDRLSEARRKAIDNPAPGGRGPAAGGFAALAIEYSDDQASRYRGGDIGWLEEGTTSSRWPSEVLEAGYALKKGEISEIIETEDGFCLVMKSDERKAFTTPFDQVAPTLRQSLLVQKRRELNKAFTEETMRLITVELDLDALASVSLPGAGDVAVPEMEPELPVLPGMTENPDSK